MKACGIYLLFLLYTCATSMAQESARNRYTMASSYFGLETGWLTPISGAPAATNPSGFGAGRLTIGGIHFWTRADFYISFPLYTRSFSESDRYSYSEGVITGGRYLPLGLKRKRLSPFVGIQWVTPGLQIDSGPEVQTNRFGMDGGFTLLVGKSTTIELYGHYIFNQTDGYYLSQNEVQTITSPNWGLKFGVKKYLDFTAGIGTEAGQQYQKDAYDLLEEKNALSGLTLQAGISASIALKSLDILDDLNYLPSPPGNTLHTDFGIGYFARKTQTSFNLSYRPLKFSQSSFDASYSYAQQHLHIEAFKFLFDYIGFAPFLGLVTGATHRNFELKSSEVSQKIRSTDFSYGLIFGWDIRPSDTDWFYLRTNLRYLMSNSPAAGIGSISVPQLEVNFIQFVFFPSRYKSLHK